jgi:CheY-like chemotaxis protein
VSSILCIDSDIRAGQRLKDLLQPAGHSVTTAWSFLQGIRELRRCRHQVVIMPPTISLPGDGERIARALKSRPHCAALVLHQGIIATPGSEMITRVIDLIAASTLQPQEATPPEERVEQVA